MLLVMLYLKDKIAELVEEKARKIYVKIKKLYICAVS